MDLSTIVLAYRGWWGDVARHHSLETARTYRSVVARAFAEIPPDRICDPKALRVYIESKRGKHASIIRSGMSDLFRYFVLHGHLARNPLDDVQQRRTQGRRIRRALEHDELIRLLVAATFIGVGKRRWSGQTLAWAILAQYSCGLRPGEIGNLTVDALRLDSNAPSVYLTNTKTGHDRIVPLNLIAVTAFRELTRDRVGRVLPFGRTQYWEYVRRSALHAGIDPDRARPYALRHSFATHLIERGGVSPRHVADLMGHVDMRHMWTYSMPSDAVLRDAVSRLDY